MNAKTISTILMIAGVAMFVGGAATKMAVSPEFRKVLLKAVPAVCEALGHIDPKRLQ